MSPMISVFFARGMTFTEMLFFPCRSGCIYEEDEEDERSCHDDIEREKEYTEDTSCLLLDPEIRPSISDRPYDVSEYEDTIGIEYIENDIV